MNSILINIVFQFALSHHIEIMILHNKDGQYNF